MNTRTKALVTTCMKTLRLLLILLMTSFSATDLFAMKLHEGDEYDNPYCKIFARHLENSSPAHIAHEGWIKLGSSLWNYPHDYKLLNSRDRPTDRCDVPTGNDITYYHFLATEPASTKVAFEYRYWIQHDDLGIPITSGWISVRCGE